MDIRQKQPRGYYRADGRYRQAGYRVEKFVNQVRQQTGLTAGIIRLRLNERANSYLCKNGPRTIIYSYGCGHPVQGKGGTELRVQRDQRVEFEPQRWQREQQH